MNDDIELLDDTPCSITVDCIDFWMNGPGDHGVRPCRPEHLEHAMAERAKVQAAEAAQNKTPPQNGAGDGR